MDLDLDLDVIPEILLMHLMIAFEKHKFSTDEERAEWIKQIGYVEELFGYVPGEFQGYKRRLMPGQRKHQPQVNQKLVKGGV